MNPFPPFSVVLEITPPRELRPEILMRRARLFEAERVHVIQRPDRLSSLEASLLLADAGFDPVWHVVNRGRTRDEIEADVRRATAGGIRRALCVRGEGEDKDGPTTPRIREIVARLRESWHPDSNEEGSKGRGSVGVTLNQYGSRERALPNLFRKLEAGADFIQMQPVFDLARFESWADEVKQRVPSVEIVPMLMPAVPQRAAQAIALRLGVRLGDPDGWRGFAETLQALAESPLADGVAILTPTMDATPEFAEQLRAVLSDVLGQDGTARPRH